MKTRSVILGMTMLLLCSALGQADPDETSITNKIPAIDRLLFTWSTNFTDKALKNTSGPPWESLLFQNDTPVGPWRRAQWQFTSHNGDVVTGEMLSSSFRWQIAFTNFTRFTSGILRIQYEKLDYGVDRVYQLYDLTHGICNGREMHWVSFGGGPWSCEHYTVKEGFRNGKHTIWDKDYNSSNIVVRTWTEDNTATAKDLIKNDSELNNSPGTVIHVHPSFIK